MKCLYASHKLPLGEFIAEAVTPPSLLHTISLPFEANVKKLNVAKYQEVTKGYVLAEVTGTEWIGIQQKAIAEAIEYQTSLTSYRTQEFTVPGRNHSSKRVCSSQCRT